MKRKLILSALACMLIGAQALCAEKIDRRALVGRHCITTTEVISKSPAQVGNGKFAFGMDITGLQTFTQFNTLSDWGWHSDPLPEGKTPEDYSPVVVETHGEKIAYKLMDPEETELSNWLKWNPHRINLGRIGFILLREDGSPASAEDITDAVQHVDIWTGEVSSSFSLGGRKVDVRTVCHPRIDMIAVKIESALIEEGRLAIYFDFPYSENNWISRQVGDWSVPWKHVSSMPVSQFGATEGTALIRHEMDGFSYGVGLRWTGDATVSRDCDSLHRYTLKPCSREFEFTALFSEQEAIGNPDFEETRAESAAEWEKYWMSGAAVDFSGSKDPRWFELERRVVLSQYQMKLNESGLFPPQESGLVNDGWYGRFHWEMTWWHAAHWYLWGRPECAGYLRTYRDFLPEAEARAQEEGRKGARWPKCTGNFNREWPCDTHAWLIWQQPHPIWFAEAAYRLYPSRAVLDEWKDIVVETADYMADYVFKEGGRYVIGPPVTPVSENTKPMETMNPAFELAYFRYGLRTALEWADRLDLPKCRTKEWRKVLRKLAELPQEDGYYITHEGMEDMWHKFNFEHPALAGVYGWLPGDGVDIETFRRTFYRILSDWQLDKAWGWDYPVLAMAAARLGDTQKAVDLLCTTAHKFAFDAHGLADCWPFPYFPANGGVLTAVAMMCAGWEGIDGSVAGSAGDAPGFPKDGSWTVRYEGLNRMQ